MKFTVVSWQSYYNMFYRVSKKIKEFEIKVFSARILENESQKLVKALEEIKTSEILLVYRSTQESFWEILEEEIKNGKIQAKIIYLSHDPAFLTFSNVEPKIIVQAHEYILRNGEENIKNLFYFLANKLFGLKVNYQEPENFPWEGLYHPKADKIFKDIREYLSWYGFQEAPTVGIIFSRHYWITDNLEVENLLILELEKRGFNVIPIFAYSLKDSSLGTRGLSEIIEEWLIEDNGKPRIDLLIKLTPFFLGASRNKGIEKTEVAEEGVELLKRLNVPVIAPVSSFYKTIEEWEREELNLDIGWAIALPEFEGVIEPIIIAAQVEGEEGERRRMPIPERINKLVERVARWIELRKTPFCERKIAFILHNNPCASVEATVGSAAHLDSLESVVEIMKRLKEVGYQVEPPENGKSLMEEIMKRKAISEFRWTTVEEIVSKGGALALISVEEYLKWFSELPEKTRNRMIEAWGNPPGEYKQGIPPAMVYEGKIVITGLRLGNVVICVQPKRGCAGARCDGQVCKILHDPEVPPPHQYVATYKWLSKTFGVHAIVHVGTHGNLEFLPGKGVALSSACFPDIVIDTVPHLYIYNADNPPEGTIAKRRSYAVLIDHLQTVMTEAGLYEELEILDRLLGEYEETKKKDPTRRHTLEHLILSSAKKAKLDTAIKVFYKGQKKALSELSHEEIHQVSFEEITEALHTHLSLIRNTQIQDGMHIFGKLPEGQRRIEFIYAIMKYDVGQEISLRREIAKLLGYDLETLLAYKEKVDEKTKKSYGAILEEIDKIGKEIVKKILKQEGVL
ncbi:MAG: cobaltochelatase subunit CobN [Thermodesulfobacteriaceae bacterium]|nr:cobaltochelatase subunit CobN [Thermodesulfobacteriaceae bacterium]